MARSIRLRLQIWYGAILALTILILGILLYFNLRSSWLKENDARMVGNLHYLDVLLRNLPPGDAPPPRERQTNDRQPNEPPRDRPPGGPQQKGKQKGPPPNERQANERSRDRPPGPPPRGRQPGGPPSWERFLAELQLPPYGDEQGPHGPVFAIWDKEGKLIHESGMPEHFLLSIPGMASEPELWDDPPWRLGTLRGPDRAVILIAQPMHLGDQRLKNLAWMLVLFGGLALGLGLLGGWFVSKQIVRPVQRISETATAIHAKNLSTRIDIAHLDQELIPLGNALNAMLNRIDLSFKNQIRFTADASHEMRTPLTVIKSQSEWALLRDNRSESEYREALQACLRGSQRMERLVEDLLELARSDAKTEPDSREPTDLSLVVSEAITLLSEKAKSRQIEICVDLQSVCIKASSKQIERLAINLIGNAISHNPAGTVVRVSTGNTGRVSTGSIGHESNRFHSTPFLSVSDNGIGIEPDDLTKLGERFFRCDASRSKAGSGLGIAIVKGIVETHGAELLIESTPGKGSTFTVNFPTSPPQKDN